jgi:small GTP-binding protein
MIIVHVCKDSKEETTILMGVLIAKLLEKANDQKNLNVVVIGLDGAGKTNILYKVCPDLSMQRIYVGLEVDTGIYSDLVFTAIDLGGGSKLRLLWRHYFMASDAIIFVVDASDEERMEEAKRELDYVLLEESLKGKPLLIMANKQDHSARVGSMSIETIIDHLKLQSIRERSWYIQGTSAVTSEGIYEGIHWLKTQLSRQ